MKKTQVSTEFLIFVSMSVVLLMVYMAIANNFLNIAYQQKEVISAQDLAKILRNEFNLASRVENGYIKEFQLPYQVDYKDYDIEIPPSGREISISYADDPNIDFTEMLSTNVSVIGAVLKPGNTIFIKKQNDNVVVSSPYCVSSQQNTIECRSGKDVCVSGTFSVEKCAYKCVFGNWILWSFCDICDSTCIINEPDCSPPFTACSTISPGLSWTNDPCGIFSTELPNLKLCYQTGT
ncbi:MAG: hypothetical protein V1663_02680 [archaeon]